MLNKLRFFAKMATALTLTLACALPLARAQSLDDDEGALEMPSSPASRSSTVQSEGSAETTQPQRRVGRKAAQKYMGQKPGGTAAAAHNTQAQDDDDRVPASLRSEDAHYLQISIGTFVSDNAYRWGQPDPQNNVGSWSLGVTYRIGQWLNSMDLGARVDFQNYHLGDGTARKLSFMPVVTFPDATSKFPLYFGGGIGPGIFLNQIDNKSQLSIDYTLFAGVRFFDLYRNTGAFIEAGLKNHFLLLSDGQFNGYFVALGAIFTF